MVEKEKWFNDKKEESIDWIEKVFQIEAAAK